jgi:hypothetical protein
MRLLQDLSVAADVVGVELTSSRPETRRVVEVALIALVAVAALCGYWFAAVAGNQPSSTGGDGKPISTMYDPPHDDVQRALVRGDGQLYAALATDPAVRHPGIITGPPAEQAYRYQRPGYGWLAWMASGGQRAAVEWALVVLTSLSVVGLVAITARSLIDRDQDPRFALLLLVAPGVLVNLLWIGPEAFGTLLVMVALRRMVPVEGSTRLRSIGIVAFTCLAAAGLCRESLLLVPATLAVLCLTQRRWRMACTLAATAVPYAAWVLVLRARIGAWPVGSVPGRLAPLPFLGMIRGLTTAGSVEAVFAVVTLGIAVGALVVGREPILRLLIATNLAFASMMGTAVWHRFDGFGRVLLPMTVFSLLSLVPAFAAKRERVLDALPA